MWEPWRHTTLWASTACYRDSFTHFIFIRNVGKFLPEFLEKHPNISHVCAHLVSSVSEIHVSKTHLPVSLSAATAARFHTLWLQSVKTVFSNRPGHTLTSHTSVQPSKQCGALLCCHSNGFQKESNAYCQTPSQNEYISLNLVTSGNPVEIQTE
jgi:hypothetical protein